MGGDRGVGWGGGGREAIVEWLSLESWEHNLLGDSLIIAIEEIAKKISSGVFLRETHHSIQDSS